MWYYISSDLRKLLFEEIKELTTTELVIQSKDSFLFHILLCEQLYTQHAFPRSVLGHLIRVDNIT